MILVQLLSLYIVVFSWLRHFLANISDWWLRTSRKLIGYEVKETNRKNWKNAIAKQVSIRPRTTPALHSCNSRIKMKQSIKKS